MTLGGRGVLDISFLGAALAGFGAFFTPCILPMVPFYLCYMAGISMQELRGEEGGTTPVFRHVERRLFVRSVMFAFGVTTIFMLMGVGASAIGHVFAQWQDTLRYVAAVFIFVFGLHFVGVIKIATLMREMRIEVRGKTWGDPSTILGAYGMGLAFGFGWSACVGPVLATILMIAGGMGDMWHGAALLAVFGAGMTAPFVVAAMFARPFLAFMARHRAIMRHSEKAMGAMLIVFAILMATGSIGVISNAMVGWGDVFRGRG